MSKTDATANVNSGTKTMCTYRMDEDVLDMLDAMKRHFKCQKSELLRFVVREYYNGPFQEIKNPGQKPQNGGQTESETTVPDSKPTNEEINGTPSPIILKEGSALVRIYTERNGNYKRHVVVYFDTDGKRVRERIVDLKEAKERASEILRVLAEKNKMVVMPSNAEDCTRETLKKLVACVGRAIIQIIIDKIDSLENTDGPGSPTPPNSSSEKRDAPASKNVNEVLDEFLESKKQDGIGKEHLRAMESHIGLFANSFDCPISSITGTDIDGWLRKMQVERGWSGLTRNQYRANISNLMNFAISKRYLPLDWSEMRLVGKARVDYGAIKIYTPEEAQKLMDATEEDTRPYLALALFAGIRQAEIMRMDWKDIWWGRDCIDVGKQKIRTAGHRYAPLLPNCAAWLKTCQKESGPICGEWISGALRRLGKRAGVPWQHNAPRHSYISYRVLMLDHNISKVAGEVGNSAPMINAHYRSPITRDVAELYFAVKPG